MTDELDDATIEAWWRRQRDRQGLPYTLSASVIRKVITLASPEIYMTDEELEELRRRRAAPEPPRRRQRKGGEPMNVPKVGTCYCGCGTATAGHFAPGHDQKAAVWLAKLETGPASRAAMVLVAGYGPGGRNLREAARAAGLVEPGES